MSEILVLAEAAGSTYADVTFEVLGAAQAMAARWDAEVVALVIGPAPDPAVLPAGAVLRVAGEGLETYNPAAWLEVVSAVVGERDPRLVLLANTTAGMDLGGPLAVRTGRPLASYVVGLETDASPDNDLVATCQLFGGRLLAERVLPGGRGICAVAAGAFPPAVPGGPSPQASSLEPPATVRGVATIALGMAEGEDEDTDIKKAALLVSVGRGLGSADNVPMAQALCDAIGAALSGTSQVCDLGWLPRTRHVGKSGVKVRPRAYLAFGISGAPEHLEGIRTAELIVACNTDPAAPIFDVAHYGTTEDALALLQALTDLARRDPA